MVFYVVGFWQPPAHLLRIFTTTIYVLAWGSAIVIAAGLAGNLVVLYGSQFQQVLPMTSLTRNITNFYEPSRELAVLVDVVVDYRNDLGRVERITTEVAREVMRRVAGGVLDFEPCIRYHTFSDSSVNFTVIMRAREFVDQFLIKHEFVKRLHERYQREGSVIPFPSRTV